MCEVTWSELVELFSFYWDNLSSLQIRMEFWGSIIIIVFVCTIYILLIVLAIHYFVRYWTNRGTFEKIFVITSIIFFIIISVLAYPQLRDDFFYYVCKRKFFIREDVVIDTVLGYVYEYEYECYRGRRSFYKGGGYVKYVYRVSGVDSILRGEYKFEGSFLCDIDTGFYYVIVPRGKWDNSIILLERRIPWDTIRVWRELMRGEDVDTNELNKQ